MSDSRGCACLAKRGTSGWNLCSSWWTYCMWSFAWCLQCSCWFSWCWYCGCNSFWQPHCLGGRGWCRCSWCYITNVGCVWFDSIWMTFSNMVTSTSVQSTTNDVDHIWAHYWLCRWWWQGITGSLHHWEQIWFGQWRMEVSCGSLTGHGTLHFGWHVGWGGHIQCWHVGQCAWSVATQWCIALSGITSLQVNTGKHQLACYSMLVELSMGLDQSAWHKWAFFWWSWWLLQVDHCF